MQLLDDGCLFLPVLRPFFHCVALKNKGLRFGKDYFGVHPIPLRSRFHVHDVVRRVPHFSLRKALESSKKLLNERLELLEVRGPPE